MKKIGEKAMTQAERTRKYRTEHNLGLFSTRVDGELLKKLRKKIADNGSTQREFLENAAEKYISE